MLDFGGQYSQLIARRIRECGVFAELLPHDTGIDAIRARRPARPRPVRRPRLRVLRGRARAAAASCSSSGSRCWGSATGCRRWRGRSADGSRRRSRASSAAPLTVVDGGGRLLAGTPDDQQCWMSHRDTVFEPPPGFAALASSPGSPVAALENPRSRPLRDPVPPRGRPHPVRDRDPDPLPARDRRLRAAVVARVGDRRAGGADPRAGRRRRGDVRAVRRRRLGHRRALVHRAVGDQLTCVLVDHGLLRKDEAEQVVAAFREGLGIRSSTSTRRIASSTGSPE